MLPLYLNDSAAFQHSWLKVSDEQCHRREAEAIVSLATLNSRMKGFFDTPEIKRREMLYAIWWYAFLPFDCSYCIELGSQRGDL
jgi:hypothetical protein